MDESARIPEAAERLHYEKHENTPDNPGYVGMFREFIDRAVRPHHPEIRTALDFGCGPGPVLAALLAAEGTDVTVYDPFFAPDAAYRLKTYDLITATEVFEHLSDPAGTAGHLAGLLNPGGLLALMTLFHPGDSGITDWWYRRDPTHISFFRPATLMRMAEQSRLRCVYQDTKRICVMKKETGEYHG